MHARMGQDVPSELQMFQPRCPALRVPSGPRLQLTRRRDRPLLPKPRESRLCPSPSFTER